jgi:3-oxoadipate enol-lactonase
VKTALQNLLALLDKIEASQAIFIGHSLGGNIGQELVFQHSERVKALVSVGCTWNFQKMSAIENLGIKLGVPMMDWYPYATLIHQMAEVSADQPESRNYLHEAFSILSKEEFVQVMKEATGCLHYEPDFIIPVPMLLIVGDNDRTGNIRKVAPLWASHEKHCTFVLIPNGMHAFNLDMPDVFHNFLLDFLQSTR